MADHTELVAELSVIDKWSTQERLKQARKRRLQQLKKWSQREKEYNSKRKKTEQNMNRKPTKKNEYKVHFVPSVMLLEAAARNDIEEVRRLLMLGVSPDSTNEDGLTALHQCCIDDSEEMMKLLIDFGANVNAKDSERWTPLHAASTCGLIHLVEYLISKGADLLAVNADGNMPYDICEDEATLDFIEVEMSKKGITQEMIDDTRAYTEREMLRDLKTLMDKDGDLEFRDHQGATPLHIAAANGYSLVVEFLLDQNVSTDITDKDLWQPIHAAACWGHPDVIELLVQAGADLSAKTKNGETPYDICEDPELKDRIVQLKCEMETKRASQPHKLRRSQSQNTRSQSVRRTSIREKTQISRREALEEARMRQEKQEHSKGSEEDEESKLQKDINERENPDNQDFNRALVPLGGKDTLQKFKSRNSSKDFIDTETNEKDDTRRSSNTSAVEITKENAIKSSDSSVEKAVLSLGPESSSTGVVNNNYSETSSKSLSGESVKVEIVVTFNASPTFTPNPGTLADLKKQRNDMRNNSIGSNASTNGSSNSNGGGGRLTVASSQQDLTVSVPKFRSDPSEIVGEPLKRGCCAVM